MHVQFNAIFVCTIVQIDMLFKKRKAIKIQSMLRMHNQKSHYINMNACAIKIQCFVRYCQANVRRHELLESLELKRAASACIIQSKFRMYYCANQYAIQKAQGNQNSKYVQNA